MARSLCSDFQSTHGPCAGGELFGFQPHALEHGNEEIREWVIVQGVECKVLAVLEPAASEEGWQISCYVGVRIAQVATIEDHCAVQERVATLMYGFEFGEEVRQQFHVPLINRLELAQLGI